jgi:hypothetical protein
MKYANLHGYTDVYPYEVVRVISDKTIEVRAMNARPDPNWKPNIIPGGFAGHCINQDDQTWVIESNPSIETIRMRKRKDGKWYSAFGRHVLADDPKYYYDYNF